MSILGQISRDRIDYITNNLGVSNVTRDEIRNILYGGRVTTVTDPSEFTPGLKQVASEIAEGQGNTTVIGEIIGSLEGGAVVGLGAAGLIVGKGVEIANELSTLLRGTNDEATARSQARDNMGQIANRGVYHLPGSEIPTREPQTVIDSINRYYQNQSRAAAKRGEVPDSRTFGMRDPTGGLRLRKPIRSAGGSDDEGAGDGGPIEMKTPPTKSVVFGRDHQLRKRITRKDTTSPLEDIELGGPQPEPPKVPDKPRESFPPLPPFINITPAHTKNTTDTTPEINIPGDNKGESNDYAKLSHGWLRPEFNMIGTDFFDNQFSRKDLKTENSEWTEFNFVKDIDGKNKIEIDNYYNDMIRYKDPLFFPIFQEVLAPPSKQSLKATKTPMTNHIQLFDPFKDKFDDADLGRKMTFTYTYNRTPFDKNFNKLEIYNP